MLYLPYFKEGYPFPCLFIHIRRALILKYKKEMPMNTPWWQQMYDALAGNYTFLVIVLLFLVAAAMFVLFMYFQPSEKSTMRRGSHHRVYGQAIAQANPTNGLVNPELEFPVIAELTGLDKEGQETEMVAYSVKVGPKGPVFLYLKEVWQRLDPIRSLHHEQIEEVRKQIAETGEFFLNLAMWKLGESFAFRGELLTGQIFSFKGGKGFFELMTATSPKKSGEDNAIALEKTIDEFQRPINETWTLYTLVPSSIEEVRQLVEEKHLEALKLPA